jgi:endonuclease/exonuclease/phosphatase family metal-dependent hydrolase
VLTRLEGRPNVIAMGDFNFDLSSPQYRRTLEVLDDAWVAAGAPLTSGLDQARLIDHVFVSPGTPVRSAHYEASRASDHPALVVEVGGPYRCRRANVGLDRRAKEVENPASKETVGREILPE